MNKKLSDSSMILKYKDGDTSVLPALVQRYHKVFCQKAYWITKDRELAKDVAQESWIIIINKLNTLKNLDSFKSWALKIVYTKAIDNLKLKNKVNNSFESFGAIHSENALTESNSRQIRLLGAIRQLPLEKQKIIRLFYSEGYSINEIAHFLNIPIGTVKSRLFKAREKLKSIIKNYEK